MNADKILDMMSTFYSKRNGIIQKMSYSTFNQIASAYRNIFNFYIDNYEVIKNPFYDKKLKGGRVAQKLVDNVRTLDEDKVKDIFEKIYNYYNSDRAMHYECLIQLYINGFPNSMSIVELKEGMIDFKRKIIMLPDRALNVSDRCLELLRYVHSLT